MTSRRVLCYISMMLRRRADLLLAIVFAIALLAALPSFGIGFLIEASGDAGKHGSLIDVTADVRSRTMSDYDFLFRVSTLGPGGLSEPAVATIGSIERRRAVRR